ncbi:hypothetical protein EDD85DRAFT_66391 [Armillaria nabsnona]|nr:hypothetical protein EDD85DRAFT_66391 [Armillaria nabsnona]
MHSCLILQLPSLFLFCETSTSAEHRVTTMAYTVVLFFSALTVTVIKTNGRSKQLETCAKFPCRSHDDVRRASTSYTAHSLLLHHHR